MEKKQHEELELSPDQWRKGKKSTFRHVGDDTTRLEIWIHPSHPRSSQGTESGKDSEQENGLGSLSPSDVSSLGCCNEQDYLSKHECSGTCSCKALPRCFPLITRKADHFMLPDVLIHLLHLHFLYLYVLLPFTTMWHCRT